MKVEPLSLSVLSSRSQNKTKVGLKAINQFGGRPPYISQNKTKVGLKGVYACITKLFKIGQNKTKVGLKDFKKA